MDENCLVEKDTFVLRKMDFGEGVLNPSYNIPINPLKHGLVNMVKDWPWSCFHRYVKEGVYPDAWDGKPEMKLMDASLVY